MTGADRAAIQQILGRIDRWRNDDKQGYDRAIALLCEVSDELTLLLISEAASQTNQERQADYPDAHSLSEAKRWKALGKPVTSEVTGPQEPVHGETCIKALHVGSGYLHGEDDDKPYDVDHVKYCGRCHSALPAAH